MAFQEEETTAFSHFNSSVKAHLKFYLLHAAFPQNFILLPYLNC